MASSKTGAVEGGLEVFQKALELLQRRKYAEAEKAFARIEDDSSGDIRLVARLRMFRRICHRKLHTATPVPADSPSAYDRGILEHNLGNYEEALSLFETALSQDTDSPHVLMAVAVTATCLGDFDRAIASLRKAIKGDPFNKVRARRDTEFEPLRTHAGYQELVQRK